ncbi:MAG: Uma2 family endonuclease [Myxococcota bacterium]
MDVAPESMSFDAFLAWSASQRGRFELVAGSPVAMAPERAGHARMKARLHRSIADALEATGQSCEAFIDGMTVRIDESTAYEPDVVVHRGEPLDDDAVVVERPVVVVEVLSRSTRGHDAGAKLDDYFRLPSVAHYLMVRTDRFAVIHHQRQTNGTILTRVLRSGPLQLDPPGLALNLDALRA